MSESRLSLENLENRGEFIHRHIAPSDADIESMLGVIGLDSLDDLVEKAIPSSIISDTKLNLAAPRAEQQALADLGSFAARNEVFKSMLGMGYSDCHTPTVILRNILENPGWYTAYTPYRRKSPGAHGGAAQFPDHDHGPHRHGNRQRLLAR